MALVWQDGTVRRELEVLRGPAGFSQPQPISASARGDWERFFPPFLAVW